MAKAWVEENKIVDVCDGDPVLLYHADLACKYKTTVPKGVMNGYELIAGEWTAPSLCEEPEEPVVAGLKISVSPVEFLLLFTSPERVFIKSIRSADPIVDDFMDIIDHPKLTIVDLSLESTKQAVDYLLSKLVEAEVITAEYAPVRRASILAGAFQ